MNTIDPGRRRVLRLGSLFLSVSQLTACGGSRGTDVAPPAPLPAPPPAPSPPPPPAPSPPPAPAPSPAPAPPPPAPAPAPVPNSGARQFSLLSATTVTAPFCVGFALRQGDIPSGSAVAVSGAAAQATVKNRWPDGSAKFALVAGTASLTGGVPATVALTAGASSNGTALTTADLRAALTQSVAIGCGNFGSATWVGADWDSPFVAWVSGHLMSSWVYRKPVGADPHLVAWLEVRLFAGGVVEVLPWVENGYLLVSGPTNKNTTYTVTMGGSQRFSAAIDLPHHCRTPLVSGAALSHWLGTDPAVAVLHDTDYMQSTGMVPPYSAKTSPSAPQVLALPVTFTPLQQGSYPIGMGSGGYHASIGLLPEWDVLYLTSPTGVTSKAVQFNGYSAGRFPIHYRQESAASASQYRPARLSEHALLVVGMAPAVGWVTTPLASGTVPAGWAGSHHPSVGYMAYMLTGRWYFMDQLQFAATWQVMAYSSGVREGALGLIKPQSTGNERYFAWTWRTLAQCISATPDADTGMRDEYRTILKNNIDYTHARYIGASNDPSNPRVNSLGWVQPAVDYNSGLYLVNGRVASGATTTVVPITAGGIDQEQTGDNQYVGWKLTVQASGESRTVTAYDRAINVVTVSPGFSIAPAAGAIILLDDATYFTATWQQDFITAAWGYAKDLVKDFDTTTSSKVDRLFTWKAQSVVGRLGSTGANEYIYRDYAPYTIAIAPSNTPDWDNGTGPWFTNWGQVWAATYAGASIDDSNHKPPPYLSHGPKTAGDLRSNIAADLPGANALPAIAYCVRHGVAGAAAGYLRLTGAGNWAEFQRALDAQPVWSVAPGVVVR